MKLSVLYHFLHVLLGTGNPGYKLKKRLYVFGCSLFLISVIADVQAANAVVGSVNPETGEATVYQNRMVQQFQDGTPIKNIYARYFASSQRYLLIRSGKSADGACQTEAFALILLPNHHLVIADTLDNPWDGVDRIVSLKKCLSQSCSGACRVIDDGPGSLDADKYDCQCTGSGKCLEALNPWFKLDDILDEEPIL